MALIRVNGGNNTSKQLILYEEGTFNVVSGVSLATWGTPQGWQPKAWIDSTSNPGHVLIRLESSIDSGAKATSINMIDMSGYTRFCIACTYQRYHSKGSAGWITLSTNNTNPDVYGKVAYTAINNGQGNGNFITKLNYSYNGNLYFMIASSSSQALAIYKIWLERD